MKKDIAAAIACAVLIAYSCHKTGADVTPPASYTGTFQYVGYSGGLAGFKFTLQVMKSYIQVDGDGWRIMYNNADTAQGCGTYTFEKKDYGGLLTISGDPGDVFVDNKYRVQLQHDTLVFYPDNCADCFSTYYKPVNRQFNWCNGTGAGH